MGRKAPRLRVHLIHWKPETADSEVRRLRTAGFSVRCTAFEPALPRHLAARPPAAIVIDLSRLPSAGRDVGVMLRRAGGTRLVPLVFAGGRSDKVERVRSVLPDALFCEWAAIDKAIRRAARSQQSRPVVPDSSLAGYSGTPLPKKLGIDPGMNVRLIDAPKDVETILGVLPQDVRLSHGVKKDCDLTLWFVSSQSILERRIRGIAKAIARQPLWIAWPKKASGVASDLTQASVRQIGLLNGLVDYKVCSIDATWSGLKFVRRSR